MIAFVEEDLVQQSPSEAPGVWWTLPPNAVEAELRTNASIGLDAAEVADRLAKHGPNSIAEAQRSTWVNVLARQFVDVLIWILIGAAALSATLGELTDAVTILAIVVLNGILGFVQEWKAERALQALRQMLSPTCRVIRSGTVENVQVKDVVPGDIVRLETGDRVPADLRLLEATNLRVDESALTGESDSVHKSTTPVDATTDLADQSCMVWMGTAVTNGRALGAVVATGPATQFGRIAGLTSEIATDRTPLQRKLATLGRQLGIWAAAVSLLIVAAGLLTGKGLVEMLMTGISLAVAIVPEGLPAVVTITLALGIRTMVRRKALLRRLQAAEAVGSATVICTDKTGTLTQNQMTVQRIWLPDEHLDVTGIGYDPAGHFEKDGQTVDYRAHAALRELLQTGLECNHAEVVRDGDTWHERGEPTEAALVVAAFKAWLSPKSDAAPVAEFSFSSDRKRMTVITSNSPDRGDELVAHVKGAPEVVLKLCTSVGRRKLGEDSRNHVRQICNDMADHGLRTLAIAQRNLPQGIPLSAAAVEEDLTLLGIVGIIDPPRPEVPSAIERAMSAGIRLIMITGDSARTALTIAQRIGLRVNRAIEGTQLATMDDGALREVLDGSAVFARTTPEHKLRIVQLLQQDGHVVGMTGDGVNDAPALKKADIGIAMGLRGTDVAKGASDIVLTDDNFSSIINAVEEGRRQYDNIQKFVRYMLSSNTGEAVAIFCTILIGGPLILLPVQILWMNLITDSLIALALGLEASEADIMQRPPRDPARPILDRGAVLMITALGAYVGLATLWIFQHMLGQPGTTTILAQTMAFHGIIVIEWFNVMNFRTLRLPVLRAGLFSNRWMLIAIAATAAVQICAIYTAPLQKALHTVPLSPGHWGLIALVALPVFVVAEAVKWWTAARQA